MRVRSTTAGILVVLLLVLSTAAPSMAAPPAHGQGRAVDRALLAGLGADARVSRDRATGLVRSVMGGRRPLATARMLGRPRSATEAASAFLGRYGGLYDLRTPGRQLQVTAVLPAGRGSTVRYRQIMGGVPVMGGDLVVVVDGRRNVRAVRGETSRDTSVPLRTRISAARAMGIARAAVERATGVPMSALRAGAPTRWIYDPRLLDGPGLPYARLVWRMRVRNAAGTVDQLVAVDARTGDVPLRFSQLPAGAPPPDANQRICDQEGQRENVLPRVPCKNKVSDKLPLPYTGEALKVADATEATYDFYARRFSYDLPADLNASATLISTIRYCPPASGGGCPYRNAFWDGSQMVYGAGFGAADDVVAHELTHAVTERASNLFYYMQSGALNEALSDIFGEAVDLTDGLGLDRPRDRWKIGEDLSSTIGVIRNMKDPTLLGQPDTMDSPLWDTDPSETDSGGVHSNSGVANKAFYLMVDGPSDPLSGTLADSIDAAVAIWYRAASQLLTTASDYADLADALQIACDQLATEPAGVKDKTGAASPRQIHAADCDPDGAVRAAIAATHMSFETRTVDDAPAPKCDDPAATPTPLFHDAVDVTGSKWTFDAQDANGRWSVEDLYGFRDPDADPQDPTWHLFGADLGRTGDRRLRQKTGVTIDGGVRPVFLWFRHAYGFDDGSEDTDPSSRIYDGGVVELSADGGTFRDIGRLFVDGGYGPAIDKGDSNPLKGRPAFGAESDGYTTARAMLDGLPGLSFTGTDTRVSFRIGTDSSYGGEGWFIDDVWIYTCVNLAESDAPALSALRAELRTGSLTSAGHVPGTVRLTIDGDPATLIRASVAVGAGPDVVFGGALGHGTPTGTFRTSSQPQHLGVRVTDENGDVGTIADDLHVVRTEESGVTFSGAWTARTGSSLSGGSARAAKVKGRKATFQARSVRQIAPVFTTGPDRGYVKVCVDGSQCRTLDLYSPTVQTRRILSVWSYPGAADRTVTVSVLGTKRPASKGTTVEVDAVITLGP